MGKDVVFGHVITEENLLDGYKDTIVQGAIVQPSLPRFSLKANKEIHDRIFEFSKCDKMKIWGMASIYPHFTQEEYREEAIRCVKELGFVGLKLTPIGHACDPESEDGMYAFSVAAELGVPMMVHTGSGIPFSSPMHILKAAKEYPELKIVVAHSFIGVLMCNQSLFDEYGLEIPKTMDDLYAVSATFNENGITPIAMGEKDKWPGLFPFGALALRYGGVEKTITMLNGEGNFDQEFVQKTAEELQKMVDEGVFASDSVALTDDEATEEFRQGRAAMWYSGNWKVDLLCEEGSPLEGKLTMVNWPAVSGADGDQNSFVGGASATLVASATSAHKKEAVEFMTFMSEHFSNYAYEEGAILPTWKYSGDMELKPFQQTLLDLMQGADGFCLAWDTLLDPETADVHSTSLQGIYAQQMTADDYVEAMAATR